MKISTADWNVGNQNKICRNDFSQAWVKACPNIFSSNKTIFCFICGNATSKNNTVLIYSRELTSKPDTPYFPFMEYHDPAPGAEPMKNYSIISCFVCNAFLIQQWQSFERLKTPINKRLYWLKRPSGCEIRQPVSQIELEEILNENVRDVNQENFAENSDDSFQETIKNSNIKNESNSEITKTNKKMKKNMEKILTIFNSCYSCGESKQVNLAIYRIYIRPSYEQMRVGVPFYPTVTDYPKSENAEVLHNSITYMCISCLPRFPPQWHKIQKDFLKQFNHQTLLPRIPLPETVSCYLCELIIDTKHNDHLINLSDLSSNENLYKLLHLKTMAPNSVPLGQFGFTYICTNCFTSIEAESKHI